MPLKVEFKGESEQGLTAGKQYPVEGFGESVIVILDDDSKIKHIALNRANDSDVFSLSSDDSGKSTSEVKP